MRNGNNNSIIKFFFASLPNMFKSVEAVILLFATNWAGTFDEGEKIPKYQNDHKTLLYHQIRKYLSCYMGYSFLNYWFTVQENVTLHSDATYV